MNKIKYKAYNKESKTMLQWEDIKEPIIHHGEVVRSLGDVLAGEYPFVPLQYTGLTDKNDKEIYHKDICIYYGRFGKEIGVIEFLRHGFHIVLDNDYVFKIDEFYLEVIGNIYEDSHLLGGR